MEDPDEPLTCARPGCWRPYPDHQPPSRALGCPGFAWLDPFDRRSPDHPRSATPNERHGAPRRTGYLLPD